ncbi:MAG: hypothetical protein LBB81_03680 [Treponema sp.]|jgi:hypothetical protein|nr:hypothetical protein [Treponema sp.]
MKNRKKLFGVIALIAVIGLCFAACGGKSKSKSKGSSGKSGGVTWTAVEKTTAFDYKPKGRTYKSDIWAIAYGKDKFVAVGRNSNMAYLSDGVKWSAIPGGAKYGDPGQSTFGEDAYINAIVYGNNKFVAGGMFGRMAYSSDGVKWTAIPGGDYVSDPGQSTFEYTDIDAIAYGNNKFVAGGVGKMAYSSDGVKWTAVTDSKFDNYGITAIVYGNNKFVAVRGGGQMAYSTDGVKWTVVTDSPFTDIIESIVYAKDKFVAGGRGQMAYSSDGVTWTATVEPAAFDYKSGGSTYKANIRAIAYGKDKFVAVGDKGIIAYSTGE